MRIIKGKKIIDASVPVDLFSVLFASSLLIGYIPKASGTFGSLFALLFFFIPGFDKIELLLPLIIICYLVGVHTSKILMKKYGEDPSVIVIDEVVGMWITILVFKLISAESLDFFYLIISFLLFRFFDIVKIQPAKYFDEMNSAFGIMMDDVIAGIYAGAALYFVSLINFTLSN